MKAPGSSGAPRAGRRTLERGMAVAVVGRALLGVLQNLVGLGDLLEHVLRLLVARILVRVVLHGLLAIGLLQLLRGGVAFDSQQFVIVFFGHCVRSRPRRFQPGSLRFGGAPSAFPVL